MKISKRKIVKGECIYCNYCQPCPKEINIALVNKYLDLAKAGDKTAKEKYDKLRKHAIDCIKCGRCESNCSFSVKVKQKMEEAIKTFGY